MFPSIPSDLNGISLLNKMVEFREAALRECDRKPQDERYFISHFDMACGHDSAISILINTPTTDMELNFKSPKEHAMQLAADAAEQYWRKSSVENMFSSSMHATQFKADVDAVYPEYAPDPIIQQALDGFRAVASNHMAPYSVVHAAIQERDRLQKQLDAERAVHESRDHRQRFHWLFTSSDPALRQAAESIERSLQTQKLFDSLGGAGPTLAKYRSYGS